MESSSENSFTWTDTSSDSIDSHTMVAKDNVLDKNSGFDKHTKKRKNCNVSKMEHDDTKLNNEQSHDETSNSLQKNMVKVEPDSDSDIPKKKKKIKHIEMNGSEKDLQNSTSYDESYLDLQVKQEEMAISSVSKKKKHVNPNENNTEITEVKPQESSPKSCDRNPDNQQQSDIESKTKKKKKKSKRKSESEGQEEMEFTYNKSEQVVNNNDTASSTHIPTTTSEMAETSLADTFVNESGDEISAIQCDDHNLHKLSFHSSTTVEREKRDDNLYKSVIDNQFKINTNNRDEAVGRRPPRLSDRIRFEDEDDSETELGQAPYNRLNKTLLKLRKFVKTNNNMKPIEQGLHDSSTLTPDDDIWIVQCPKEIDVQGFCGAEFNMHGKSKIKVGGQTYDGTIDSEECNTTAVLTMEYSKYAINNLPLSGIIRLRKRIPKPHFLDHNNMVNNQTNFIPLPETKCRHPLFGSNYKKAVKIPVAVAQQLNLQNGVCESLTSEKRKKKKHKKNRSVLENEETDSKHEVRMKWESDIPLHGTEKRKKKRKQADDDEGPVPKKVKKIKHDPESQEAWESEKAIEENLFNF